MNILHPKSIHLLLAIALVGLFNKAFGQFSYLGGGIGYGFTKVNKDVSNADPYNAPFSVLDGSESYHTNLHQLLFHVKAMHRPVRNIVVGFKATLPLYQSNTFNLDGWSTGDEYYYLGGEFRPDNYNYEVRMSAEVALLLRVAGATGPAPYFELRGSMVWTKETLLFKRPNDPGGPDRLRIDQEFSNSNPAVGFGLGVMPHISDKMYMDVQFAVDLVMYNGDSFDYIIEHDYATGGYETFHMASQLDGMKARISTQIGLGYRF